MPALAKEREGRHRTMTGISDRTESSRGGPCRLFPPPRLSARSSRTYVSPPSAARSHSRVTVAVLAVVMAAADGFILTSLQGAVGAIERAQGPFGSWLRDTALILPVFVVAIVWAFTRAHRKHGLDHSALRSWRKAITPRCSSSPPAPPSGSPRPWSAPGSTTTCSPAAAEERARCTTTRSAAQAARRSRTRRTPTAPGRRSSGRRWRWTSRRSPSAAASCSPPTSSSSAGSSRCAVAGST